MSLTEYRRKSRFKSSERRYDTYVVVIIYSYKMIKNLEDESIQIIINYKSLISSVVNEFKHMIFDDTNYRIIYSTIDRR